MQILWEQNIDCFTKTEEVTAEIVERITIRSLFKEIISEM